VYSCLCADTGDMQAESTFVNQLLIAMPGMEDPNFNSSVTLVCEHNSDGALGIIINRPMNLSLGGLFQQLQMDDIDSTMAAAPILDGGPVATERGFVLHSPSGTFDYSMNVSADIQLTLSRDVLESMASGDGPHNSVVALGYAGWEAGQLESEMLANTWLSVPASPNLVFETPFEQRWRAAAAELGIDISQLSPDAGHA
jgi:putative transcriptional regulator